MMRTYLLGVLGLTLSACGGTDSSKDEVEGGSLSDHPLNDPSLNEVCGALTPQEAVDIALGNADTHLRQVIHQSPYLGEANALTRVLAQGYSPGSDTTIAEREEDLDESLREARDEMLHLDDVESVEDGRVTFLPSAEHYCEPVNDEAEILEPDPECAQALLDTPLRIVVERVACDSGNNVNVRPQIGSDRIEPVLLQLFESHVSARLDFDRAEALIDVLELLEEGGSVDGDSGGQLFAILSHPKEGASRIAVSSPSGVRLGTTSAEGEHAALEISGGEELVAIEMTESEFLGELSLGASELVMPLNEFINDYFDEAEGTAAATDEVELNLAALTGSLNYDASTGLVLASKLSLGAEAATVNYGGQPLLTVEAGDGEQPSVSLVASSSVDEPLRCEFDAGFDLRLTYAMSAVQAKAENLPSFTLADDLSIELAGADAAVVFYEDEWQDLNAVGDQVGQLLRVAGGELSMQSTAFAAENVSVGAGECLHRDPTVPAEHGFLGTQSAGVCE